eukprot:CAMPEP_0180381022 /NCGR_PEP_ID=MMETSP0989-20121125/26409_1 /TAXON_ID=697907 /ORGANISM="non described non described, Strain CCMP2293" /LENGTH=147 /DNA_ID=CAMNT_0022380641 /DNA_START=5 /DNA_END=444 /DNA_ORIENTATION=+
MKLDALDHCIILAHETCQILDGAPLSVPTKSVVGAKELHHSTVGLLLSGTTVANMLPGAPAALSKQIHKGDVILSVGGEQATSGNIIAHLQNPDEPGTEVTLSIKARGGKVHAVTLRRMATSVVADKLRLFDLFTQVQTAAKGSTHG